jgi:hypothetical protein
MPMIFRVSPRAVRVTLGRNVAKILGTTLGTVVQKPMSTSTLIDGKPSSAPSHADISSSDITHFVSLLGDGPGSYEHLSSSL